MFNKLKCFLREKTSLGKGKYLKFLYRYDEQRYFRYSVMERSDAQIIATRIRLLVHALEKGLSAKEQKCDFGKEKAADLLALIQKYQESGENPDPQSIELAMSVLSSYAKNRLAKGEDVSFIPEQFLLENDLAGTTLHSKKDSSAFAQIAYNRHSVRAFKEGGVSADQIFSAVNLAQTAPSACNRQATRIFTCTNQEKIEQIIARHGGLRGFSNIGAIIAVTGDLSLYQNEYERNTVFVDGGIFLMNLLYALEANDLAACPIIWGAEPDNDGFLYLLLGIPESQEIISLVAVGNYPEGTVKIPRSEKRDTKDIFKLVD